MRCADIPRSIVEQVARLTRAERVESLLAGARLVTLIPGQPLFRQGEPAHAVFLVLTGILKICARIGQTEALLTILSEGEIGGILLMTNPPLAYPGTVLALTRATALTIPRETYLGSWTRDGGAMNYVNNCVGHRLTSLHRQRTLQTESAETKIREFLHLHYVEKRDLERKKITRREIAQAIGAQTETVIRILKKLEREGLIKTTRSVIQILNESALRTGA